MVKKKQKRGKVVQEGRGKTVNVSLQFPTKDWELFKIACERCGRKYEEVLRELAVKWAEDTMKAELLPPG